ncbi:conserved hypothetical protein [uncultured Desulfobacterium sp.]|uniref:HDOD domain-containing protein n=1 Tax=uncultured Desulfobacterium sp. TaxID=201089 RepID=A0A445N2P8_9BACT|nr:conserved hypothetical protein [uncultured Desulfobacterium sp.]
MSDIQYCLILEELDKDVRLQKPVSFLAENTSVSKEEIQVLLANPPRILHYFPNQNQAKKIQARLMDLGCHTRIEQVITGSAYPFPIFDRHYRLMKRELGKAIRAKVGLILFLVQLEAEEAGEALPSMLGPFSEGISDYFRGSDTVIGIDDIRFIVIGLSTGREGADYIKEKIIAVINEHLAGVRVSMGYALYPDEGRSLPKLLLAAASNRESGSLVEQPDITGDIPYVFSRAGGTLTPIQVCFTEARGKIFKRLLNMDPQSLLLGLSQLSKDKQREFLARLPFDSPLVLILKEAIDSQTQPVSDSALQEELETIVYYMELEEGLNERKKNQDEILSVLNRLESLPTLPSIASRLLMIASDPDSSAGDLTEVIMNDPSLTSRILKIINSAYYGFAQKIGTVKQAVMLLGTREIIALAFGISTVKLFEPAHLKGIYSPKALWRHSMCTGLIAENLCKAFPEYRKLGVFTAGLLHDFGKILIVEKFPELYGQVHVEARKYDLPLYDLEEEKFGINHAIIGEVLSSNWKLPEALVHGIAFHHQPFSASSHSQFAAIIGLADYLYHEAIFHGELSDDFSGFPCELSSCHWTFLSQLFPDFDNDKLKMMIEEALDIIKRGQELFAILD